MIALAFMMVFSMLPMQGFASDSVPTLYLCRSEDAFLQSNKNLSTDTNVGPINLGNDSLFVQNTGKKIKIDRVYLVTIPAGETLSILTKGETDNPTMIPQTYNSPLNNSESDLLPYSDGSEEYNDPPKEINTSNFTTYKVDVELLETAGVIKGSLDSASEYYFFAISATPCRKNKPNKPNQFDPTKLYGVLIQKKVSTAGVDKRALQAEIAKVTDANAANYKQSEDRYNGNDVSKVGFWNEMLPALTKAQEVEKSQSATKSEVAKATQELAAAISKLIPITQINPTSLYEAVHPTWVWDYYQTSDDKVHDESKLVSMKKVPVSADNCTEASWTAYTKAKEAAEDYLNSLFDEEGKPTAANVNDEAGTAQKNAEALAKAADPQQLVRKSLYETYYERYLKHREEAGLLLEQYNPQKLTQGGYDAASWDAYTKAYDTLNRIYRHKPSGGTKEDYTIYKEFYSRYDSESRQDVYRTDDLVAAYNGLKTTGAVNVSFTYVNNLTAAYPALSGGTDAYQKEEITLTGESNVYGLLKEANLIYASDISGIHRPETESGVIMPDKSFTAPYFAIFVDGEFRGIYAGEEKAKSVNLKNGNKVTVARVLQPQILNEASSGMDSTNWVWGDASRSEYQESLAMISVNPEKSSTRVGDKLTISAAVTDAYGKDLGKKNSAEGLTLFVSEPSKNQVITSPGKNTGETTDTSGKASYTFARSGWYTIALHDIREDDYTRRDVYQNYTFGTYHSLVAGDIALIYVEEPENEQALIAQYRKENLAKAKALFEQYQEYDFEDGYYKGHFTSCYTTLQEHQNSAKTFADLMERFEGDYAFLEKEAKEKAIDYAGTTKTIKEKLQYIPENLETLDESYAKTVEQIQAAYKKLSAPQDKERDAYQKRFLTPKELEKLEALAKFDADTLKKLTDVTIQVDGFTKLPLAVGIGQTGGNPYFGWPQLTWSMAPNLDGSLPAPTWSSLNYQSEFTAKAGDHAFVRAYLDTNDEKYWMVWSADGKNWNIAEPQTIGTYSGYFLVDYPIPKDIEANEITISVKMVSKAEYENIVDPTGTPEQLQAAKTAAQESLKAAYEGYQNSTLKSIYQNGYDNIAKAKTMAEVAKARKAALAALAAEASGSSAEPGTKPTYNSGKTVGKVYVTVENTKYSSGAFTGQIVDGWYDLGEYDTMMTCVLKALDQKGYGWNGTKNFDNENPKGDYTIDYLASVEKDGKTLGEFDGNNKSGWMGTLNDWFVNESFAAFSVKAGKLENGDTIHVMFTLDYGADIGGTWGNSNTKLDKLTVTGGTLSPSFSGDNTEYTLVINGNQDGKANVTVKPEAVNKNYQARIFLNSYNKDSARYKMTDTISVKSGDILYVGVGENGWPTMNSVSKGTKYTIKVVSGSDAGAVKKMIAEIKTITYSNYGGEKGKVEAARAAYNALTDKNRITAADVKKLTDAEAQIKFYQQIDDAKAKLAALPKLTNPTQAQANAYRSQINEATAAYKKLSEEQQKYITKADVENYNALAKALGVSTISGSDQAPESPVETTGKSGSATTTSPTEVKVSGTTAAATIKAENQSEILKQAAENKSAEIVLEVAASDTKGAENVQLQLETSFVKSISDKTNASLILNTANGRASFDQEALKTIISEAKGSTILIEIAKVTKPTEAQKKAAGTNGDIFRLLVKSGDKIISEFNKGKATVRVEIPAKLLDKKVAAIHIADDDKIEQLAGKVLTIGGKKYYEFTMPHSSTFALVDADELGLEVEEPQVDAKALTAKLTPVARSAKNAKKNVKVTVSLDKQDKAIIKELKDAGYTVKYRFYRSTKKAAGYKAAVTKKTASYTNTGGKKGMKYFYKVQVRVYDENGKLAAKTALKQCKYASRTWTKGK